MENGLQGCTLLFVAVAYHWHEYGGMSTPDQLASSGQEVNMKHAEMAAETAESTHFAACSGF